MAYGLKYQGGFYNHHRHAIHVELYLDDYVGDVTDIKLSGCEMNYQRDGNIITQSIDLRIQNTFTFDEFEILLENYEKQWLCKITNDDSNPEVFFYGFLIVDVQEQSLQDPPAEVRLTFTDHLKRLQDISPVLATDTLYSLLTIIKDGLDEIDSKDIYINSSLYHTEQDTGGTMLEQSYVYGDLFYENNVEIESYWDCIQKILHAINAYLYVYKNNYYIERYNDIPRESSEGTWRKVDKDDNSIGEFIISIEQDQLQEIADTDYKFLASSAVVAYHSGLSNLEVNVENNPRISIIPSAWTLPLDEWWDSDDWNYPSQADIDDRTWYISPYAENISVGQNDYGFNNYITYELPVAYPQLAFLIYMTKFTFNSGNSTQLQLKWRIRIIDPSAPRGGGRFFVRFALRKGSTGAKPAYFIEQNDDEETVLVASENQEDWEVETEETSPASRILEFSKTIELNDIKADCETDETLIVIFLPVKMNHRGDISYSDVMIGDFEIKVLPENLDNQFLYDVNDGFINKMTEDIYLYDLPSLNYSNGLMLSTEDKTYEEWFEDDASFTEALVDKFVKSLTGFYYKTRKEIKAKFLFNTDIQVKPLALISCSAYEDIQFIVLESFQWDMISNIYTINAPEYSTEAGTINIIE